MKETMRLASAINRKRSHYL